MKTKVKKYFITYLSLVLVLSNFSFATTLAFCNMRGDNHPCACSNSNEIGKSGLAIKNMTKSCCETKIVELSNSNILEILHSSQINPFAHSDLTGFFSNIFDIVSNHSYWINNEFSFHPPNSEIPILNSSLLI